VTDDTVQPVQLGAEVGASEGRHVRHRMFAVVDRSQMAAFNTTLTTATRQGVITAATNTNPIQITSPNHGLAAGQVVSVTGVTGLPAANGVWKVQTVVGPSNFTLAGSDGTAYTTSATGPNAGNWVLALGVQPGQSGTSPNGRPVTLPQVQGRGITLTIDPNTANEETVLASYDANTNSYYPLLYQKSHAAGAPVVWRGNPGPWQKTTDGYNPRNDAAVVPLFAIID
jgi:hypothetical protein